MNLQLNHLSGYLPYGVKMICTTESGAKYKETLSVINIADIMDEHDFKPILRPLSDLTKEIEHEGERFVPYVKLGWDDGFTLIDIITDKDFQNLSFEDAQILLSWHFDIHNLIPNNLAIDINTV